MPGTAEPPQVAFPMVRLCHSRCKERFKEMARLLTAAELPSCWRRVEKTEDRLFGAASVPIPVPNELPRLDSNQQPSG